MAQPILTLDSTIPTLPTGFDITAATGGGGLFTGYSGADYGFAQHYGFQIKYDGGSQLLMNSFGGGAPAGSFGWGRSIVFTDRNDGENGPVSGSNTTGANIHAPSGGGFFFTLKADQALRKLRMYFNGSAVDNQGAHWRLTATISDGSSPPVSFLVPDYQTQVWGSAVLIVYRAKDANSTLDVRFTKLDNIDASIGMFASYLEVPVVPARPRGFLLGGL